MHLPWPGPHACGFEAARIDVDENHLAGRGARLCVEPQVAQGVIERPEGTQPGERRDQDERDERQPQPDP